MLGIDSDQELERMQKEWAVDEKTGLNLRDLFYPHIVQNTEDKGIDTQFNIKVPTTKKQIEKQKEKTKGTQEDAVKELFVKCSKCGNIFDYLKITEAGMGYVKCPKCGEIVTQKDVCTAQEIEESYQLINEPIDPNLYTEIAPYNKVSELPDAVKKYPIVAQRLFMHVWNSVYKQTKDEARAFQAAWSQLKKWMKRHGNKK
jgi:cation transport regulator ChaB/DNA-directed RNA polymerase subunit RPC12/RpoP